MGRRDWTQKVARRLDEQVGKGYQHILLWIRSHKQEILDLASRLSPPSMVVIPGVGNVHGSRMEATEVIWDKYHSPNDYVEFLNSDRSPQ